MNILKDGHGNSTCQPNQWKNSPVKESGNTVAEVINQPRELIYREFGDVAIEHYWLTGCHFAGRR